MSLRSPLFMLLLIAVFGCNEPDPNAKPILSAAQKGEVLEHLADEIIVVSYTQLQLELQDLETQFSAFQQSPSESRANELLAQFRATWSIWQTASIYEFGPAESVRLRLLMNTFPTDTTQINSNISSGGYNLETAANAAAKGFPALDFLLNRYSTTDEMINFFGNDPSAAATSQYIKSNIELMLDKIEQVKEGWENGYRDEFIANDGTAVGSAMSLFVNQFNFEFELLKNARIGIPIGKKTLGETRPELVESLWGGYSLELAKSNLTALQTAFNGGEGIGLKEYLDALGARYGNEMLSDAINAGFDEAVSQMAEIDDPLLSAIESQYDALNSLHTTLQNQVVLLKVDMPSQMGIQITYQDNDGD